LINGRGSFKTFSDKSRPKVNPPAPLSLQYDTRAGIRKT
jgi:hypothetical protein